MAAAASTAFTSVKPTTGSRQRNITLTANFSSVIFVGAVAFVVTMIGLWVFSGRYFPQFLILAGSVGLIAVGAGLYPLLLRTNRANAGVWAMLTLIVLGTSLTAMIDPALLPVGTGAIVLFSLIGQSSLGRRQGLVFALLCASALAVDITFVHRFSTSVFGDSLAQEFSQSGFGATAALPAVVALILVSRQIALIYEKVLAKDQAVLRMLVDHLPDNVFVKDTEGRIILDNVAHARHMGNSTPESIIGKSDFDFFPQELAQKYYDDEQRLLHSGESKITVEEPTIDPDGNELWLQTTKVVVRDDEGNPIAIVGINHDITALRQAEAERSKLLHIEQTQRGTLEQLIEQIINAVARLNAGVAEILAAVTQQSSSMVEQEAAIAQTLATVQEVRGTVAQTAERAQDVAGAARNSATVSRTGQVSISDSIDGMSSIKRKVEHIAETILVLSERTQQIDEIIDSVNAIAEQSKLLALNASIEAARAGEEGRGFAVVAMEVRQLADQSREATGHIRDILKEIQQATNTAVMATEEGSKEAERGVHLVEQAGNAIRDLAATIEAAALSAAQIAASTHQQSNGMEQLSLAMAQIRTAASQTVDGTRQMEHSVHGLMEMAEQLERAAVQYSL